MAKPIRFALADSKSLKRHHPSPASLTTPLDMVVTFTGAVRSLGETYIAARDRGDHRQAVLGAYLAHLAYADRCDARAHDSFRDTLAFATRLIEGGHVDAAIDLFARLVLALTPSSPLQLAPCLVGGR